MAKKTMSLADIAKAFNIDDPSKLIAPEVVEEIEEFEAAAERRSLEAETVIFYIQNSENREVFLKKTCMVCGRTFLSSYKNVGCCSDECRKDYLASKGMSWNPKKRESERWGGTIPKIIGPEATEMLQGMTFPEEPETSSPVEEQSDESEEDSEFDMDAFLNGEV